MSSRTYLQLRLNTGNCYMLFIFVILMLCSMNIMEHNSKTNFDSHSIIKYLTNHNITTKWRADMPSIAQGTTIKIFRPSIAEDSAFKRRNTILKQLNMKCNSPVNLERFQGIVRIPDSNCSSPFVTVYDGGRLGNQICELMSIWIFRKHFGMRILISNRSYLNLKTLFSKVSVAHGYSHCFKKDNKIITPFIRMYNDFDQSLDLIKKGIPLMSTNIHKHNFIPEYPCRKDYFINYRNEIRSLFVFKPDLMKKIERIIDKNLANVNISRSSATLISVHVCRTDYINYTFKLYNTTIPGTDFYTSALDLYSRRFERAVFVVLSDDIKWCKKHFRDYNFIYPGTGRVMDPSIDFATITLCDHHIISSGTFSFTSAFLGRGSIAYDASNKSISIGLIRSYICSDPTIFIPIV